MVLRLPDSWSNWNLEILVSWEEWKTRVPREKRLRAKDWEPTTNSTHIRRQHRDLNMDHTDGRQVFSALRHPYSPCTLPTCLRTLRNNYISIAQTWESFRKYPSVGKVKLSLLSITTVCWKKCKQIIGSILFLVNSIYFALFYTYVTTYLLTSSCRLEDDRKKTDPI